MAIGKKPAFGATPSDARQARADGDPRGYLQKTPAWRFGQLQFDGCWSWSAVEPTYWRQLHEKLRSVESMTWTDIERSGSHQVELARLHVELRNRLRALRLDDLDGLFSLRLSGTERVWGIRDQGVLRVLFWDPDHEICPSKLKYT